MSDLLDFISRHWVLVALFVIAFIWLISEEMRHQGVGGVRQSPDAVVMLMNHDNAAVVDLRDMQSFKEGHIANSINLPFSELTQQLNRINKYKQSPLVLVCAMGRQSFQAMNQLKKNGFEKVYVLAGGLGAWKKANLPLKKK